MKKTDGKSYVSYEMTKKKAEFLGFDIKDQFGSIMMGRRFTTGVLIEAPEDVCKVHRRFDNNEEKRIARAHRCRVESEKTGKLIRCTKDCKECSNRHMRFFLSLDRFKDEDEMEVSVPIFTETKETLDLVLKDALVEALKKQDPLLADVFCRVFNGDTQQQIADDLGLTKRAVQTLVERYRRILQGLVTREDIMYR